MGNYCLIPDDPTKLRGGTGNRASMRPQFDHDYPPGEWTAEGIADALREGGDGSLPTCDDTAAFERLHGDDATGPAVDALLADAREHRDDPVPELPASIYLEYERTGQRPGYEAAYRDRTRRLSEFALAECFDREGDFLDPLLDHAWAVCEQTTWTLPAHLGGADACEGLPVPAEASGRTLALRTASVARTLSAVDGVLGDRLHPALRERIRHEVERQVFEPFLEGEHWWDEPPTNNWNAVCNANTLVAALYLADPDRAGRIAAEAARSMRDYLADFDPDGATAEGVGYWNYGFGNYVVAAAELEAHTDGEYSLLEPPVVPEIARFPLRVRLSEGRYPAFSDAHEATRPSAATACYLGERLDEPGLAALGRQAFAAGDGVSGDFVSALRTLQGVAAAPEGEVPTPPRRAWFGGHQWWVARAAPDDPDGLVVAVKGGNNGESHNHNDVGTFVVHAARESSITDPGVQTYTDEYFGERRYEFLAPRSLSHPVAHPGVEQAAGSEHAARVVDRTGGDDEESLTLDLAGCYPDEAGLERLERTYRLERGDEPCGGRLVVRDAADFAGDPAFESVLVAHDPFEVRDDGVAVERERTRTVVTADRPVDVETEHAGTLEDARNPESPSHPVERAYLRPESGDEDADVALELTVTVEPL